MQETLLLLKARLLACYTRQLIKSNRIKRINVGFEQAKTIGILYSLDNLQKQEVVQQLATRLNQLDKQVTILCYTLTPPQAPNLIAPTITHHDIKLWGSITPPQAKTFINTPFDYLYYVDPDGHPVLDYLLAKSHAKCRVGYYCAKRTALFEIMINFERKPNSSVFADLATQMLHYTQRLKTG